MNSTIAWPQALGAVERLVAGPDAAAEALASVLAGAPCFQNRDFPLSPTPVLVRADAAEHVNAELEAYVALLGEVCRLYRERPEVRAWYGLPESARRLIEADRGPGDLPWICRLDGYLEAGSERLVLLENNADAPAGTLFSSRINELVERVWAEVPDAGMPEPSALTYRGDRFLGALLDGARAAAAAQPGKCASPSSVAILQPRGAANRESAELVDEFQAIGMDAFLGDPRELSVSGGRASFGGRPADLCWNKVNTSVWNELVTDAELLGTWETALRESTLVHLNNFAARYVAESKLSLAFVQEPAFADCFTAAQRELVDRLLPRTRRVRPDGAEPGGAAPEELLAHQCDYVLKQPYDIRGDGVTVGYAVPRGEWRAAVGRAAAQGHIAQRRVEPLRYPVVALPEAVVRCPAVSLDTFVFGGKPAGFGSKCGSPPKINVFQGGRKLAVYVVAEPGQG